MIQDIYPHSFNNKFVETSGIRENDYVFHFIDNSLLFKQEGDFFSIPIKKDLKGLSDDGIFLFALNNINCFLVWKCVIPKNSMLVYSEISFLRNHTQNELDWAASVAFQLKNWYEQNRFCGRCGSATRLKSDERAIVCPNCHKVLFPSISPAIIVAIRNKEKILMARNAHFKNGFYSLVAGYVDAGETVEDAVRREVKEEVGLEIKNIHYYKSQPWPFSSSMMIGFIADVDEQHQDICIDNVEIVEADWYTRDNLPSYPPIRSIAGEMIEKFIAGEL